MPRALIIGYGNPLRSDDGLGWHAVQALSREPLPGDVELIFTHQLTPELVKQVSDTRIVVFIDVTPEDGEGATSGELKIAQLSSSNASPSFSHQLSPGILLGLAQQLYGACPRAYAVSLVGANFELGETLSQPLRQNLPVLVEGTLRLVSPA
jgi:hydrogenase maturation protease